MATVSKFESRLIAILRAALGVGPREAAVGYLFDRLPTPPGLGHAALQTLREDLPAGCILALARAGGWRRERFLRDGKPVEGRVWQRTPAEQMPWAFTRQTIDFLLWLTAQHPAQAKPWEPDADQVTVADWFVQFRAYDCFRDTEAGPAWRRLATFAQNPLCRLAFPDDFAGQSGPSPGFAPWGAGLGSAILEGLQGWLAERWLAVERAKSGIADWSAMRALGESQDAVLAAFAAAINAAGRRDLARFLLHAVCEFRRPGLQVGDLVGGLGGGSPMRLVHRIEVRRRAGSLLRFFTDTLAGWERQARGTGYLDEGYAAAQLYLADWESAGAPAALPVARAVLAELVPVTEGAAP